MTRRKEPKTERRALTVICKQCHNPKPFYSSMGNLQVGFICLDCRTAMEAQEDDEPKDVCPACMEDVQDCTCE